MDGTTLHLGDTRLIADPAGALFVPSVDALLVADLHFEKASAFAVAGAMLPPYDTAQTIGLLDRLMRKYQPATVYCLGDSFHDAGGVARIGASNEARLRRLATGREWIWIAGNHDVDAVPSWGQRVIDEVRVGSLTLRHEAQRDGKLPGAEISGHYHPKAAVRLRGRRFSGRCFVTDGRRLILPAFGALTGGLDVTDPAIAGLMQPQYQVLLSVRGRLLGLSSTELRAA